MLVRDVVGVAGSEPGEESVGLVPSLREVAQSGEAKSKLGACVGRKGRQFRDKAFPESVCLLWIAMRTQFADRDPGNPLARLRRVKPPGGFLLYFVQPAKGCERADFGDCYSDAVRDLA